MVRLLSWCSRQRGLSALLMRFNDRRLSLLPSGHN